MIQSNKILMTSQIRVIISWKKSIPLFLMMNHPDNVVYPILQYPDSLVTAYDEYFIGILFIF